MTKLLDPITPGSILREFMDEHAVSAAKLAREIDVNHTRIVKILNGQRAITADTALRLARYFGAAPQFWLNLQCEYDLRVAERQSGKSIRGRVRISPRLPAVNAA